VKLNIYTKKICEPVGFNDYLAAVSSTNCLLYADQICKTARGFLLLSILTL